MKGSILSFCIMLLGVVVVAQDTLVGNLSGNIVGTEFGVVSGVVVDRETREAIPYCKVWIRANDSLLVVGGDANGNFRIDSIPPGKYDVYLKTLKHGTTMVQGVPVKAGSCQDMDTIKLLPALVIACGGWDPPLRVIMEIEWPAVVHHDVQNNLNQQRPINMLASFNDDVRILDETSKDVVIRGSRPEEVIYFIDGVKSNKMSRIPAVGIDNITAYTGGILAKYGDTTGGVISLETKGYFDLYYSWGNKQ
ncbi:MAG: TonB-dependent receptor [Flavobacteriales bacterium]|nr:TonB-dependent receptor [Flavobacteriales bacterium]